MITNINPRKMAVSGIFSDFLFTLCSISAIVKQDGGHEMIRKDKKLFKDGSMKTQVRVTEGYRPYPNSSPKQRTVKSFGYLEDQEDQAVTNRLPAPGHQLFYTELPEGQRLPGEVFPGPGLFLPGDGPHPVPFIEKGGGITPAELLRGGKRL